MAVIIGGSGISISKTTLLAAIFNRRQVITFVVMVLLFAIHTGILFVLLISVL